MTAHLSTKPLWKTLTVQAHARAEISTISAVKKWLSHLPAGLVEVTKLALLKIFGTRILSIPKESEFIAAGEFDLIASFREDELPFYFKHL